MSTEFIAGVNFVTEECCNCGISFAMNVDFKKRRLSDHKTFYCPAGHPQHYVGKSQEEQLRERLAAEQRRSRLHQEQAERERHRTRAQKAAKTRLKNRIANGVCPCCNRTFRNLMQHMQNQHPDFTRSEKPAAIEELISALLHDRGSISTTEAVEETGQAYHKVLAALNSMEDASKIARAGRKGKAINWKAA